MNFLRSFFPRRAAPRRWRVTGPFKGITGYDRMVRSVVPELRERGVEVELRDLPHWSPTRLAEELPAGLVERRSVRTSAIHLHFGLPTQAIRSKDCPNLNYSMFEADRIPAEWARAAQTFELTIVPTESSRESWVAGGVPADRIAVCPQGADFELYCPGANPLDLHTEDDRPVADFRCRFLNVAEFVARKNLEGLLRVWLRETRIEDSAVLILKPGFYNEGSRHRYDELRVRLESETGKRFKGAAAIALCDRQLAEAEMPRLYTAASHYWSMSFGEGFDLPMMEAAACGLQLIAPRHSSYLHYLRPEYAFLLPVDAVEPDIPGDPGLAALFGGSKWWRPNETQAADTLRSIIDGTRPPRPPARDLLKVNCTWGGMAEGLIRIVDEWCGRDEKP